MQKRDWIIFGVAILIFAGGYFFLGSRHAFSNQFSGVVDHIEGNIIFAKGSFLVNGAISGRQPLGTEAQIVVTPQTKFVATIVHAPSTAELQKTGGRWDLANIQNETADGSLEDLQSGGVSTFLAEANGNVYGATMFNAVVIRYTIIRYPDAGSATETCKDANGKFIGAAVCAAKLQPRIP